uniref:Serine protease 48 n=1 Tax=Zeugodacus cucurbitae TaxID=28588 RepID=A0A0A1X2K7_ZEUCU
MAIITLQQPFTFNHSVKPICFQYHTEGAANVETGRDSFIIGWGPTESSHYKDVLQKVEVTTLSYNSCNETLNGKATQRYDLAVDKFCVVRKGTSGEICRSDSGGGFVKSTNGQYYLVGVISHAPLGNVDCARDSLIALTNVQYYVKIRESIENDQIEN